MNIQETLQVTEQLHELLDRRARILEDLQLVDAEIAAAYAAFMGTSDEGQRALPPAKAPKPPRQRGCLHVNPTKAPKAKRKAKKKTVKKTSKKSPKMFAKKAGKESRNDRVIMFMKKKPAGTIFTPQDLIDGLDLDKKSAQNAMVYLYKALAVDRIGRGEYRLPKK